MLNIIQKFHAIMVSEEVVIWHYPGKADEQYYYWLKKEPENKEGYGFYSLAGMIEAAYAKIDPLLKPLPETVEEPNFLKE